MKQFLCFIGGLLLTIFGYGQGINYSHLYNSASEIDLEYKVVYNPNNVAVLLNIKASNLLDMYEATMDFRASYSDTKPDSTASIFLDNAKYDSIQNIWTLDLSFKRIYQRRLLLVQFIDKQTGMTYTFDIPLSWHEEINQPSVILSDTSWQYPFFNKYINTSELLKTDQFVWVNYYPVTYDPASPPMETSGRKPSPELSVDSIFVIRPNEIFSFKNEGLYFIESDTSNFHGSIYRVCDAPFPRFTSVEKLIAPMRYLVTNNEFQQLNADPTKSGFEKVWLDIAGDEQRAIQVIKKYYGRVEEANSYFTSFKEGWKTDMGMLFIIFGIPDEVYKFDKKEEWIYKGSSKQSALSFTFIKVENVFDDHYFVLQRNKKFKTPWMNQVDLWRKNRIK